MSAPKYAYDSDAWWPDGLPEWIGEQVAGRDELFVALDKGLRSFGWPAYNVPRPLPMEDSWPGLALALAQRIRTTKAALQPPNQDADFPPAQVREQPQKGET